MKTLKIIIGSMGNTTFFLKGLSFKALAGTDVGHNLVKSDLIGGFDLEKWSKVDGKTANIRLDFLVESLKELYEEIPFDKIKIVGRYEVTGEQLYKLITEES